MEIRPLKPSDVPHAAPFVARLQTNPAHHIAYFGMEREEIAAAIREFEPPHNGLVAVEDGDIIGLLAVDTDEESRRAWLYGPMVDGADWDRTADTLYYAAHHQQIIPPFVEDEELFVDVANQRVQLFATRHGFTPGMPHARLRLGKETMSALPTVDRHKLDERFHAQLVLLHESLFPGSHYSGAQLIERMGERHQVFVATDGETLLGYVSVEIEPEATNGYIDYLGVADGARRRGVGRRLIVAASRWAFDFPEISEVTLTVSAQNTGAIALYTGLGFEHLRTLQSFRKR